MTLRPPKVRAAEQLVREHRRAVRKARPKAPRPVAAEGQRQPRILDKPFLAFVRTQGCAVGPVGCFGPIESAHIRYGRPGTPNPGLQRKSNDRRAVGLCAGHHRLGPDAQHRTSERAWWSARNIDPDALAAELGRRFDGGMS